MHRKDAIAWVLTVCAGSLRLSQAKTLAILVASAMSVERVSLANNVHSANSETFGYDNLNRLRSFSRGTSTTASWSLDAVGNRNSSTADGTTTSRTNNSQNQIITDGSSTLGYDANGNTTTDENGNTLVYNAWNQFVAVKNGAGTTIASYTYDALGRRISAIADAGGSDAGTDQGYTYQGLSTIVGEADGNGVTETTTLDSFGRTAEIKSVTGCAKTGQRGALKTGQCFDDAYTSSLRFRATFS